MNKKAIQSENAEVNPYESPNAFSYSESGGTTAPRHPIVTKITWTLMAITYCAMLFLLIVVTFGISLEGDAWADVPTAFTLIWLAIPMPLSSAFTVVYCLTVDRNTHRYKLRLALSCVLLLLFLIVLVANVLSALALNAASKGNRY